MTPLLRALADLLNQAADVAAQIRDAHDAPPLLRSDAEYWREHLDKHLADVKSNMEEDLETEP